MLRSIPWTLVLFAISACHRNADTVEPSLAEPAERTAAPAETTTPTEPTAKVDCSSATITAVLEQRTQWSNEGGTCLSELEGRCESEGGDACLDAATILVNGLGGVTADEAAATALLTRACELGDDNGCKASKARAPKKPAALVADANVTVESLAADGLELRELACAMESMPLFGTVVIAGTLAKQKRAIDRCAPAGQAFAVTWTFTGGKVKDVAVQGGTDAANKCVAKAVARAAAPLEGRCGAVILAGDAAKAATTIEALRPAAP